MSIRFWSLAAAALLALPLVADAGVTRQVVKGRLTATASGGAEKGRFLMGVLDRDNGRHVERIETFAHRLNVATATASSPPSFHVWLVLSDGSGAADMGAMRVNRRGDAVFIFDTRRTTLPSSVNTITDYGGGTIEVRDGSGSAVLSGSIPAFGGGSAGSATFGKDQSRLRSTSTSFAGSGHMTARRQNLPRGVQEQMSLTVRRMANATTYTAVAIDASSNETTLGTFTTSDPRGLGGFRISTRQGGTIPGGGVLSLAGQTVEVRDSGGTAVLTGVFPTVH
jgi:hypothetical protein